MVENILESNYNIFSNNDHVELSSKRIETTDSHSKIWRLMGVNNVDDLISYSR